MKGASAVKKLRRDLLGLLVLWGVLAGLVGLSLDPTFAGQGYLFGEDFFIVRLVHALGLPTENVTSASWGLLTTAGFAVLFCTLGEMAVTPADPAKRHARTPWYQAAVAVASGLGLILFGFIAVFCSNLFNSSVNDSLIWLAETLIISLIPVLVVAAVYLPVSWAIARKRAHRKVPAPVATVNGIVEPGQADKTRHLRLATIVIMVIWGILSGLVAFGIDPSFHLFGEDFFLLTAFEGLNIAVPFIDRASWAFLCTVELVVFAGVVLACTTLPAERTERTAYHYRKLAVGLVLDAIFGVTFALEILAAWGQFPAERIVDILIFAAEVIISSLVPIVAVSLLWLVLSAAVAASKPRAKAPAPTFDTTNLPNPCLSYSRLGRRSDPERFREVHLPR